jgi:hypothetical protein
VHYDEEAVTLHGLHWLGHLGCPKICHTNNNGRHVARTSTSTTAMGLTEYPPWAWYTDGNTTHCGHERDYQNRGVSIDGNDIDDKLVKQLRILQQVHKTHSEGRRRRQKRDSLGRRTRGRVRVELGAVSIADD